MNLLGWLGRGILALLGLLMAANVLGALYFAVALRQPVTPVEVGGLMWDTWVVSWIVAVVWSRRTAALPPALDQLAYWLPTIVMFALFSLGSARTNFAPLWHLSDVVAWALTNICAACIPFHRWARITAG